MGNNEEAMALLGVKHKTDFGDMRRDTKNLRKRINL